MVSDQGDLRICPYLRGRKQPQPQSLPSPNNHCVLAASIHLPNPHQSRYCLGGRHETCRRYQRQQSHPLPRYVTGIQSPVATPGPARPDLKPLVWRRPWFRRLMQVIVLMIVATIIALAWQWRQATLPARLTPTATLPATLSLPTSQPTSPFAAPTSGAISR